MVRVVFVAPFAADTTLRFVRSAAQLPDVRMALVSQEAPERVPAQLRERLVGFRRVTDAMDAGELESAVRSLEAELGGKAERLIGVLEQLQVPLAHVRERLSIRGMDAHEARNFRDKSRMKDVLRANGLPCAAHQLCANASEALEFAARAGFPLVAKPPAGAGARNTLRVDDVEQLRGYLRSSPPSDAEPLLLEEFITGEEFSFDTVTLHGRHLLHSINMYVPAPLTVLENAWIQWAVLLPRSIDGQEFAPIFEAGPRALDALGIHTGITHMEWFRRPDGRIAISEVAARPPGAQFSTLISYAHDFDLYHAWARLCVHEQFDVPERRYAVGAAYLRGQGQGKIVSVDGLDEIRRELGSLVVEWKQPALGQGASGTYEGEGFVIVRHPQTEVVRDALSKIVRTVRVRLGQ
ncbi:MAG: ATP-grasp domain-containing protein [Planctomycetes bacterium]|nr:ATP-grasp domain-containing protein [Planctomycetota bacterium]